MGDFIFVLAAAIAVFGILISYKKNVNKIKDDPEQVAKAQQSFFISASIVEALPIMLIIIGFINREENVPMETLYMPAAFIIGLMIFAIIFIFLQRSVDVTESNRNQVNQFSMIAMMLVLAIPVVALVMMFLIDPI